MSDLEGYLDGKMEDYAHVPATDLLNEREQLKTSQIKELKESHSRYLTALAQVKFTAKTREMLAEQMDNVQSEFEKNTEEFEKRAHASWKEYHLKVLRSKRGSKGKRPISKH